MAIIRRYRAITSWRRLLFGRQRFSLLMIGALKLVWLWVSWQGCCLRRYWPGDVEGSGRFSSLGDALETARHLFLFQVFADGLILATFGFVFCSEEKANMLQSWYAVRRTTQP